MQPKGVKKTYSKAGPVTTTGVKVGSRRGNRNKGSTVKSIRHAEMVRKAVKLRVKGLTYEEIAFDLGCNTSTAANLVKEAVDIQQKEQNEDIDTMRRLELARLDELYKAATEPLHEKPHMIEHPLTGKMQEVKPDKNEAVKTAVKVMERRAKLAGLDAAGKFDSGGDAPVRVYIGVPMDKV